MPSGDVSDRDGRRALDGQVATMKEGRVYRRQDCIAAADLECSTCERFIMMGAPYLRIRIEEPDDDGVLVEAKRLTLCLHCRDSYQEV